MTSKIINLNYQHLIGLLKKASKYDYLLLGESTHGTQEFYQIRFAITILLVSLFNYNTIFIEMEWSLGYQLNSYIHNKTNFSSKQLLEKIFVKYPKWMSANKIIQELLRFLRKWNDKNKHPVYLYGIDCQDLELANKHVCREPNLNCPIVTEIIKNYAKMTSNKANYWNLRDTFWYQVLEKTRKYRPSRFILWAHNSHIGDATANIRNRHHINIGSLLSTNYQPYLIGFSTAIGTVRASSVWGGEDRVISLNVPIKDSYEYYFHQLAINYGVNSFIYLTNRGDKDKKDNKTTSLGKFRYIGVIYQKENELKAHYITTDLNQEYHFVVYIDNSHALDVTLKGIGGDIPDRKIKSITEYQQYAKFILNNI